MDPTTNGRGSQKPLERCWNLAPLDQAKAPGVMPSY